MFKVQTFFAVLSLISIPAICAVATAGDRAGNGGPYSGPNFAGVSVPVQPERSFSLQSVHAVTGNCLTEFAGSIWEQAYRQSFASSVRNQKQLSSDGRAPAVLNFKFAPNSCEYSLELSVTGVTSADYLVITANRCKLEPVNIRLNVQNEQIKLESPIGLPFLRSEKRLDEELYDHFGRLDSSKIQSTQFPVSMVLPDEVGRVRLLNSGTNGSSKIVADFNQYSQCLRTRLR